MPRLLVLICSVLLAQFAAAQDPAPDATVTDSAASAISLSLDRLDTAIADLKQLRSHIDSVNGSELKALHYRLDARTLDLLTQADQLADRVFALPKDDPGRGQLQLRMGTEFNTVAGGIFNRIERLEHEIEQQRSSQNNLSGKALLLSQSQVQNLEGTRDDYLRAMVNHVGSRGKLGLTNEAIIPQLQAQLSLQAETLAGKISFIGSTLKDIDKRLASDQANTELLSLRNDSALALKHNLERLRTLVDLMERVEVPATDFRSLIVQQTRGISVDLIQPGVMHILLQDWLQSLRSFISLHGPDMLLKLSVFAAVLLVFRFLATLVRRTLQAALDRSKLQLSQLLKNTLISLSSGTVMLVGILMALSQLGISLAPMLAGLGIAGFIVGFALQDTLANFAAGAMILLYRPYDVDDYVEVTGAAGAVKKMNLVSTTITTFDNQTLVVPNGKIWGDVIKNVTGQRVRRVDLEFGISYSDDIAKAEQVLKDVAAEHALVLPSPETIVRVHSLGDSSVNLILRPWVRSEDYWAVRWDLIRAVKLRFDETGITIPFPQRHVHLGQSSSTT